MNLTISLKEDLTQVLLFHRQISQREKLVSMTEFQTFYSCYSSKNGMDAAKSLQSLRLQVVSYHMIKIFPIWTIYSIFCVIV